MNDNRTMTTTTDKVTALVERPIENAEGGREILNALSVMSSEVREDSHRRALAKRGELKLIEQTQKAVRKKMLDSLVEAAEIRIGVELEIIKAIELDSIDRIKMTREAALLTDMRNFHGWASRKLDELEADDTERFKELAFDVVVSTVEEETRRIQKQLAAVREA